MIGCAIVQIPEFISAFIKRVEKLIFKSNGSEKTISPISLVYQESSSSFLVWEIERKLMILSEEVEILKKNSWSTIIHNYWSVVDRFGVSMIYEFLNDKYISFIIFSRFSKLLRLSLMYLYLFSICKTKEYLNSFW